MLELNNILRILFASNRENSLYIPITFTEKLTCERDSWSHPCDQDTFFVDTEVEDPSQLFALNEEENRFFTQTNRPLLKEDSWDV